MNRRRDRLTQPAEIARFRTLLLAWYRVHRRQLSWRETRDPYRIWVSEVMLQQTRVDQMQVHFRRFLERFPTVSGLAAATEDEVLRVWEGLGYYARARNLHRAAQRVVAEYGGRLPEARDELLALPGIGPYTAAALCSIAFDQDHPVLDGNVARVLCRLLRLEGDPASPRVRAQLIAAGERLLAPGEAGDFNQAMMELGSRICTPRRPQCPECPVAVCCRAHAELEDPSRLPVRRARRPKPHLQVTAGLIWRGRDLLIAQRPRGGMLGGMWEFPGGKQEPGETLEECLTREIREELGIAIRVGERLVSIDHAYTHFRITLHAFAARHAKGTPRALGCAAWCWVRPEELGDYAFPRTDRRIIAHLQQSEGGLAPPQPSRSADRRPNPR